MNVRGFGSVQKSSPSEAAASFTRRAYFIVREHGKLATCLREAATAKAGNTARGFFQQTLMTWDGRKESRG